MKQYIPHSLHPESHKTFCLFVLSSLRPFVLLPLFVLCLNLNAQTLTKGSGREFYLTAFAQFPEPEPVGVPDSVIVYIVGTEACSGYATNFATGYQLNFSVTASLIEMALTVWRIPNINFDPIPEVVSLRDGGNAFFLNHTDSAFLTYPDWHFAWDFGDDSSEENLIFSPSHTYADWGDFTVTFSISNTLGCHAEASRQITVEDLISFPNIITPNGDGKNDVFAIMNLNTHIDSADPNHYRENLLTIYNRWGKKVYEAKNYDTYIKGEELIVGQKAFSGQNCPDGTYYFTFYYKGKLKIYNLNGTLMIVQGQ